MSLRPARSRTARTRARSICTVAFHSVLHGQARSTLDGRRQSDREARLLRGLGRARHGDRRARLFGKRHTVGEQLVNLAAHLVEALHGGRADGDDGKLAEAEQAEETGWRRPEPVPASTVPP